MMKNDFEDIVGFQWDDGNVDKNLISHGVENWECEQVFFNEPLLVLDDPKHSVAESRWAAFGATDGGRPMIVVFTRRGNMLRVISARDVDRKESSFVKKCYNRIPQFKNEDEEREFWATHSPLDYFDSNGLRRASFPNLKPSLKSISIRVPSDMLAELKTLANKMDVPYQSLAKVYLARQIALERGVPNRAFRKKDDRQVHVRA
jgi:uncharacterized protein